MCIVNMQGSSFVFIVAASPSEDGLALWSVSCVLYCACVLD